jgi:glycosyltransferase involved in cell wall biosynthesis
MKIAIDATFNPHGGSKGHLQEFIVEFSKKFSKSEIILYLKNENTKILNKSILEKCTVKIIKLSSYGNFFRILWVQLFLPIYAKFDKIDVLFCPGNFSPIFKTTKVKAQWIATIGPFCKDMYIGMRFYQKFTLFINKWLILFSGYTSNLVIHQAKYSLSLFQMKYNFNKKKQFLIECGKDEFFNSNKKIEKVEGEIKNISNDDLLCVSHLYPYKNIERLIHAFSSLAIDNNYIKLYIVGKKMHTQYFLKLEELVNKLNISDRIIFTGMISKNDLKFAYSKCKLFIFPSLCESSGYTLIEAMSCGAAILASDKTAIPFTCKQAAEYFDAYSQTDLTVKMRSLMQNESQITQMKQKSLQRSAEMINYKQAVKKFLDITYSII